MADIKNRTYAHPYDRPLDDSEIRDLGQDPNGSYGVGASSEAIGGFYGMGWVQYFQDRNTGEVYGVACSDGVNGGKDAHDIYPGMTQEYDRIMTEWSDHNTDRTDYHISVEEWNLLLNYRIKWRVDYPCLVRFEQDLTVVSVPSDDRATVYVNKSLTPPREFV